MKHTLKSVRTLVATLITFGSLSGGANAAMAWNWEFGYNKGTVTTTGATPVAGVYLITGFSVTESGDGALIGSLGDGTWNFSSDFATGTTSQLVWDGNEISSWLHDGNNFFDWVIFEDTNDTEIYFGFETGNVNTALSATISSAAITPASPSFVLSVTPIPEPSSALLVGLGALGFAARRRRIN